MQTLTIGRSQYTLNPTRDVGTLQDKFSKCTGKPKKPSLARERRDYPVFEVGMSTAMYVNLFQDMNDKHLTADEEYFAPLNKAACTLYSGADVHEFIDDLSDDAGDPVPAPAPAPVAIVRHVSVEEFDARAAELQARAASEAAAREDAPPTRETTNLNAKRAAATLDKPIRRGGEIMTRREFVALKIGEGLRPTVAREDRIQPMTRMQSFRATNEEQRAHDARIKAAGQKDVFYLDGFEITKTEHDHALSIIPTAPFRIQDGPEAESEPTSAGDADAVRVFGSAEWAAWLRSPTPRGMGLHKRESCEFKALRVGDAFQFDADGPVWTRVRGGFRPGCGGQLHACNPRVKVIRYTLCDSAPVAETAPPATQTTADQEASRKLIGSTIIEQDLDLDESISLVAHVEAGGAVENWTRPITISVDSGAVAYPVPAEIPIDTKSRAATDAFDAMPNDPQSPKPTFGLYRYARKTGQTVVAFCPSVDGYKTRAARLAEYCKFRYVGRARGYVGTEKKADYLRELFASGFDASAYLQKLIPPAQADSADPLPGKCDHPPRRLFTGYAMQADGQTGQWVACCDCGEVLRGGATLSEAEQHDEDERAPEYAAILAENRLAVIGATPGDAETRAGMMQHEAELYDRAARRTDSTIAERLSAEPDEYMPIVPQTANLSGVPEPTAAEQNQTWRDLAAELRERGDEERALRIDALIQPLPCEPEADDSIPAPLNGLDVTELTGAEAMAEFKRASLPVNPPGVADHTPRVSPIPAPRYRRIQTGLRVESKPALWIPPGDPRSVIPARFAPCHFLQP